MDDMREVLDLAASSPDSRVRGMALRYREALDEMDKFVGFFALYKNAKNEVATPVKVSPAKTPVKTIIKRRPREPKEDTFAPAIRDIILAHGAPMKLSDMREIYLQQHPNDQTTPETFRQRLVKRRTMPDGITPLIVLVPKRGYWWADQELTDA